MMRRGRQQLIASNHIRTRLLQHQRGRQPADPAAADDGAGGLRRADGRARLGHGLVLAPAVGGRADDGGLGGPLSW
jgi:hypothetical protein